VNNLKKLQQLKVSFFSIYSITQKNDQLELNYLNGALNLIRVFPYPSLLRTVYGRITEFYNRTKTTNKALLFLKESTIVNDSLVKNQQLDRSELMKSALTAFKLEKETGLLQKTNTLQAETLQLQNRILFISFIFGFFLIAFIIGFYFINKHLRKY